MQTFFKSQGVWELMEVGFVDQASTKEEADKFKGIKRIDTKALFLIQQIVHDTVFSTIVTTTMSAKA